MARLSNGYPRRSDGSLGYRTGARTRTTRGAGAGAFALLWAPTPGPTRADTLPELDTGNWSGPDDAEHAREVNEYRLRKRANEKARQRVLDLQRAKIRAQARDIGLKQFGEIMRAALRRMNSIGLAIDIAQALYDLWSENKRQIEQEAQRMSEMWAGKAGWQLYLD